MCSHNNYLQLYLILLVTLCAIEVLSESMHKNFFESKYPELYNEQEVTSKPRHKVRIDRSSFKEKEPEVLQKTGNRRFDGFLRSLFFVFVRELSQKKCEKVLKHMSDELKLSHYSVARKLGKHLKQLSKKKSDIQDIIETYELRLNSNLRAQEEFLLLFNDAFTVRDKVYFDDYLYTLSDYARDYIPSVEEETSKIIRDVILQSVERLDHREKRNLKVALRRALIEFETDLDTSDSDY